ncbi:50S ribosomal protein L23 [bacterium]|nr:50S ribosomal protein L23 [bacterium]
MSNLNNNKETLYDVIKRPIITEKSMSATTLNKYTFEVLPTATKIEIAQAIEAVYPGRKVTKVTTVYRPSHAKRVGYSVGRTQSGKKAIVTIEGEPLEELMGA